MENTEQTRAELVSASVEYFHSNPDVDKLVVVVGTGVFYRPERQSLAEHEAAVAQTTVATIHRTEAGVGYADQSSPMDVEGAEINAEFPVSVGLLELALGSIKLAPETPRKLAEALFYSGLQAGLTRAAAISQVEAVLDYLMTNMEQVTGNYAPVPQPELATITPSPLDELLEGALHIPGILADAPAAVATAAPEPAAPKAPKVEKPTAAPKAVKAAKPARVEAKKKATTPKASK